MLALFRAERARLGNGDIHWYHYWNPPRKPGAGPARWIVVRPLAFAHYRVRRDGVRYVSTLVVAEHARRLGLGRRLLEAIGRPVLLKTDARNVAANAFYARTGLWLVGRCWNARGDPLNVYQGF